MLPCVLSAPHPLGHQWPMCCALRLSLSSVFVLKGGLLSLRASICRKSCLATTESMQSRVVSPPPHLMRLLYSPRDGVAWTGWWRKLELKLLSENLNRREAGGGEKRDTCSEVSVQRCCICLLPTGCFLHSCRRNGSFPRTASLLLSTTQEKLSFTQHAIISSTGGQRLHHTSGCRLTLS